MRYDTPIKGKFMYRIGNGDWGGNCDTIEQAMQEAVNAIQIGKCTHVEWVKRNGAFVVQDVKAENQKE